MAQSIAQKFNDADKSQGNKHTQFPITCIIKERARSGRELTKRRAFYGGPDVARRDLSGLALNGERFICLSGQDLTNLDLSGVNFSGADLSNATCKYADFTGAKMDGANIEGADLTGATITPDQLRKTTGKPYAFPHGRGVTGAKMAALRKTRLGL